MAIFQKHEIAKKCGVSKASVTKAISDKRLIESEISGKKVIDDRDKINKFQINYWLTKLEEKRLLNGKPKEVTLTKPKLTAEEKQRIAKAQEKTDLELELKRLEVDKKRLEKNKLMGKSIPTDLVANLFVSLGQSFQSQYKIGSDKFLTTLFHKTKAPDEVIEQMTEQLTEMINKVHSDAIDNVKRGLKKIVQDQKQN